MATTNKPKYDPEYISYVESGESAAVFITRDIVRSIDTTGKWVDVLRTKGHRRNVGNDRYVNYKWDFKWIEVELFPRKHRPVYSSNMTDEQKKYVTWQTATDDIDMLRDKGYVGAKFRIELRLVNENEGKWETVEKLWNRTFHCYTDYKTSSCEIRKVRQPVRAKWVYHVVSIKRI